MYIRDLQQYVFNICDSDSLDQLGSNKEKLLQKIFGWSPSSDYVESIIASTASFASNAEEQLFYEFVQNAYDANADSLFFYANKEYLIILNNGFPFYTDFINPDSDGVREGQLYNFLAKGKSLKRSDATKLGKYGQGSKLLYTLLTDVTDTEENEAALIKTIYQQKKGPYLISWYNRNQLANLLQEQGEWHLADCEDYENNLLFAKILMTYYPIAPGISETLFSNQEALDAIKAFDTLVNPRRNLHFLNRGTALIVPLGLGKYERITAPSNLDLVRTRLAGFALITKNQERNAGKAVQHIYVMGEEIEQHEAQSVFVEFEVDDNPFSYHFAFNPVFANRNFVNLFKVLPILETKLQLGFIIDSQKFDVDDSRQRIIDKEKTKRQLIRAFTELIEKLRLIKRDNPTKFDYIYKAIVASVLSSDDNSYMKEAFQVTFVPFLKEFVRCDTGEYLAESEVRRPAEGIHVKLSDIGITDYQWIDDSIKSNLYRFGIRPQEIDFPSLIRDANDVKLSSWLKGLSADAYAHFFSIAEAHKDVDVVKYAKIFRSDRGNLYSYEDLLDSSLVFFAIQEDVPFGGCERIPGLFSVKDEKQYYHSLFGKIKANIAYFQSSDANQEDAANLLDWLVRQEPSLLKRVRQEIPLLRNWHDAYVPFCDLLSNRPQGSILFDNYTVKGYVPEVVRTNGWLLDPVKEPKEFWLWVVNHWKGILDLEEWGENTHHFIADLNAAYKAVPANDRTLNSERLTLYLDSEGRPVEDERYVIYSVSRLTRDEYNYLDQTLPNLRLLPFEYIKDLKEGPFIIHSLHIVEIVSDGIEADEHLLKIIFKLTENFLAACRVEYDEGIFKIHLLSGGLNYCNTVSQELKVKLQEARLYPVPEKVQELMGEACHRFRFEQNEDLLVKAVERIALPLLLLPYVANAGIKVLDCFFQQFKRLDIDTKLTAEDYRWQLIELAVKRSSDERDYVDRLRTAIRHDGKVLPESITNEIILVGDREYSLFELDVDYYNDNRLIDSFFGCLPSAWAVQFFKDHYYDGKTQDIAAKTIYSNLKNNYLNVNQLCFCLDYALTNGDNCRDLELSEGESLSDALDMVLQNHFVGFDKHCLIKGLDLDKQFFADPDLLLPCERLPEVVYNWLNSHPEGVGLFSHLMDDQGPFIATRRALLQDLPAGDLSQFANEDNDLLVLHTIEWVMDKAFTYAFGTNRFHTIMAIIEQLPDDYRPLPLLRYTGEVAQNMNGMEFPCPTFKLFAYKTGAAFLSWEHWNGGHFQRRLAKSKELADFMREHVVFLYGDKELLFRRNLDCRHRWKVLTSVELQGYPEYDDPVYRVWKESKHSNGFTFYTSNDPITMSFHIRDGKDVVFKNQMRNDDFGFDEHCKRIIIRQPNPEGLSVMKCIAKHIGSMPFFQEAFIALQSLYVEQWELSQQTVPQPTVEQGKSIIDLSNSSLTEEQVQDTVNKISRESAERIEQVNEITQQLNGEELGKVTEFAKPIKELISDLDKNTIERMANEKDKIIELLTDSDVAEHEERESQVRQTIGFLGELIYGHYLEHKHLVRNQDFVHAALEGIGEYDFEIKPERVFVDVKTTLYSLKDGTAPFYLHRSQNLFMQQHPDAKYHIVRISLKDLQLVSSYNELKAEFGTDANPLEDPLLRKRCEKIAARYWMGARIDEFDALSPEYAIKIYQKVN